jgi:hypothetical protein
MQPYASASHPALRTITAIVCILALFTTSASCLHTITHQQAACSHCTVPMPSTQNTKANTQTAPACCSTARHTNAALVSFEIQQTPHLQVFTVSLLPHAKTDSLAARYTQALETPPLPPRIALRI